MPIKRIFFGSVRGRDVHILRGQPSRDLGASLRLVSDPAAGSTDDQVRTLTEYKALGLNDVEIEFRPLFPNAPDGDEYVGRGLRIHRRTGVVSFESGAPPAPLCNNFLIEAAVLTNTGGPKVSSVVIRVQIHTSLTRIWLTPATLTVRPAAPGTVEDTGYRFTVRAEFDDGTVGDVTVGHGFSWSPSDRITPPTSAPWDEGLIRIGAGVMPGQTFEITARPPAAWSTSQLAKATVKVGQPWSSDPAMPEAELVWGDPVRPPETVPNLLFFGDGFGGPGDRAAFDRIATVVAHELSSNELYRPFDVLSNSINYWSVGGPASTRGISVRCEVFFSSSSDHALPLPGATRPVANVEWKLGELLFAAGLPVPNDFKRTNAATDLAAAMQMLRTEWAGTMHADFKAAATNPATLPDIVIRRWLKASTRTFIDELDTFPAMALGIAPAAGEIVPDALQLHTDRGGAPARAAFLASLKASNKLTAAGGPIGKIWAHDDPALRFNDTRRMIFVAASHEGTPATSIEGIGVSVRDFNDVVRGGVAVVPVPGRAALAVNPADPLSSPDDVGKEIAGTVGHEICHTFGLGDEYGGVFPHFDQDEAWLSDSANVTSLAAVAKPDPANGNALRFNVDDIKWNWERIRKAAVIAAPLVDQPGSSTILVPVLEGHAAAFNVDDVARLRVRRWREPLGLRPQTHAFELKVAAVDPPANQITLSYAGATISPGGLADFTPGSLVYVPVPAPESVRSVTYRYARMIAPYIEKLITTRNEPLTDWECKPEVELKRAYDTLLPRHINVWDRIRFDWSHRDNSNIVGLYSGGEMYACGVFHPAGSCKLRGMSSKENRKFCAVCRYVLVDAIDPSMHFWINKDYDDIYPD